MAQATTHTFAIALPSGSTLHLHLTLYTQTLFLVLASSSSLPPLPPIDNPEATSQPTEASGTAPNHALTTLIAAVPSKDGALTTPLYADVGSVDFATRLGRVLVGRLFRAASADEAGGSAVKGKMTYIGVCGSVKFWDVEEEGMALRKVVQTVLEKSDA